MPLIWFKNLESPVDEILWNLNYKQNMATSAADIS